MMPLMFVSHAQFLKKRHARIREVLHNKTKWPTSSIDIQILWISGKKKKKKKNLLILNVDLSVVTHQLDLKSTYK